MSERKLIETVRGRLQTYTVWWEPGGVFSSGVYRVYRDDRAWSKHDDLSDAIDEANSLRDKAG